MRRVALDRAHACREYYPMVVRQIFLAAFAIFATAALAQTPDPDLPAIDPPDVWRQMTFDDATSDSKCVGKFETALCAVETVIACFTRVNDDLCSRARLNANKYPVTGSRGKHWSRDIYRVDSAERLTDDTILDIPRWTTGVSPGDIRIDIRIRQCTLLAAGEYCSSPVYSENIYTARKTEHGWRVVDWGGPDIRWPGRKRH